MSALDQYIELYKANESLFKKNSAPALNAHRDEALQSLINNALPKKGSENFPVTDLESILAPDFGLNPARVRMDVNPAATFRCEVPNLSTSLFLNLNDIPAATDMSRRGLPESIVVGSLRQAAIEHPELIETYYNRLPAAANVISQLDTMLAQDGFVLYVPDGVKVEKPIQLVNIASSDMPLMSVRRILVILGKGAEAKLLCCDHTQSADTDLINLQTIEIFAGEDSHFDFYDLEESTLRTARLSTLWLSQEKGSNVLLDGITLYNGRTRNEYHTVYKAPGAELRLLGMGIADKNRLIDNFTVVNHNVPRCRTDEMFKYVVDDESTGSFSGLVYVAEGATGTEAYQSNRNMVGSKDARMYSKPQLEIYNDDVKCSHGCATGTLDEMQLFYMRTRGLDEHTARTLLKQAFMADVIDAVRLETLRDRLRHLVDRRLSGSMDACSACSHDCAVSF